jgi:hypothetical protein
MKLFEYHNYPLLPEDLKQEILNIIENSPAPVCEILLDQTKHDDIIWSQELGLPLSEVDKYSSKFHVYDPSEKIIKWVSENIPEKIKKIHINEMTEGTHLVPHIDEMRIRAINYVIETGGSNVTTNFYRVKKKYQHLKASPRTYIPRNKLIPIEKICIQKEKWHSLSVQQIHDVRNIKLGKRRIILTLSVC